ncbi:MAG: hypothetical protein LUC83_07850 [Clostridiales bacterium]|nr:hypothetical protein [Clostridiales bacterium]
MYFRKSSIVAQMDTILSEMGPIIYACVVLGIIICIAGIYAVVNMMIGENRTNISMLKVPGYPDRRINRIILSANHILLPIGVLLGIPASFAVLDVFWAMLLDYDVMLIMTYVRPFGFCLMILFTSTCYFGSVWLVGRKTRRVSMEESLKEQRE